MPTGNRSKYAILGMLELCPLSGYDIKKFSAQSISHFWKEDYGHIYPTLKLLLAEGLAVKREEPARAGKPGRHLYSITDAGKSALASWLGEDPNPPNLRIELLLKVFFGAAAEPRRLGAMLAAQEAGCRTALGELEQTEKHLLAQVEGGGEEGRAGRFQLATLRYGKSYYGGFAAWCRETIDGMAAAGKPGDEMEDET